jgi:hypothetical protein
MASTNATTSKGIKMFGVLLIVLRLVRKADFVGFIRLVVLQIVRYGLLFSGRFS